MTPSSMNTKLHWIRKWSETYSETRLVSGQRPRSACTAKIASGTMQTAMVTSSPAGTRMPGRGHRVAPV